MSLTITGLTAGFGAHPVLHNIDLALPARALSCLIGPSGSGKTTLLRCIAGLHPCQGMILAGDRDLGVLPVQQRRVGLVPQDGALFAHLSVADNIAYGLPRRSRSLRRSRVTELLELTRLQGLETRRPHQLSGGQQQRVALARALAIEPELLLLDEPFAGLDPDLRPAVANDVAAMVAASGATALLVTHDRNEALALANHLAVLRDGRLVQAGSPQDLYQEPATTWVAGFLGDIVTLPATPDGSRLVTPLGDWTISNRPHTPLPATALWRPHELTMIRTSAINADRPSTSPTGSPSISHSRAGLATVTAIRYLGHHFAVQTRLDTGHAVTAWLPAQHPPPQIGEHVHVHATQPPRHYSVDSKSSGA